jgi:hypothetical protein
MVEYEPGGERQACETWNLRNTRSKQLSATGTTEKNAFFTVIRKNDIPIYTVF